MKRITLFILLLLFTISIYAVSDVITSFTTSDTLLFNKSINHTLFVNIPRYAYISNFTLQINSSNEICMHTFANETINCSIVEQNGTYIADANWNSAAGFGADKAIDGDYFTHGQKSGVYSEASINITYYKPYVNNSIGIGAIVQVVWGAAPSFENFSLTSRCLNQSNITIRVKSKTPPELECWNGTDFHLLANTGTNLNIHDVRLFWNITLGNFYITVPYGSEDYHYYADRVENEIAELNASIINDLLDSGCTCTNCTLFGAYCQIPIIFHSETSANMTAGIFNITYHFGIDNCSEYNYTVLNLTYFDDENSQPLTVTNSYNLFSYILGETQSYSGIFSGQQSNSFCSVSNISERGLNYSIYGTFNLQAEDYTTRIYENEFSASYLSGSPIYNLPMYLLSEGNTSTVAFTIKNIYTKSTLPGIQATIYELAIGEYQLVGSQLSDIIGKVQFSYQTDEQYHFVFSSPGYVSYTFDANPITSSAYDIFMTPITEVTTAPLHERYTVLWQPQEFWKDRETAFNFTIDSPYDELNWYGYQIIYPGGSVSNYGSASSGGSLPSVFTISEGDITNSVQVIVTVDTDLTGRQNSTYYYPLMVSYNQTMYSLKDNQFGLGIFERFFVVTMLVILTVGIGALVGQLLAAVAVSFMVWGYFVYVGFIPIWAILISIFAAVILMSARSQ